MRLGQGICISHTDLTHQPSRLVSPFLQLLYRPEYPNPRTFPKCASTGLMGMSSKWIYGTSASSSDPVNIEHTHLAHLSDFERTEEGWPQAQWFNPIAPQLHCPCSLPLLSHSHTGRNPILGGGCQLALPAGYSPPTLDCAPGSPEPDSQNA